VLALPTARHAGRLARLDRALADLDRELKALRGVQPHLAWGAAALAGLTRQPAPSILVAASELAARKRRELLVRRRSATANARVARERAVLQTMVMEDLPRPRDTFVLIRGAYDKYGEKVSPGVPALCRRR
jgi:hypothetical protein